MRKLTVIMAAVMLFAGMGINSSAQEKKEGKKVKIKIEKNEDGKITKIDTLIVLKENENLSDVLKKYDIDAKESNKDGFYTVELIAEDDGKHEAKSTKAYKMVFISDDGDTDGDMVSVDEDFENSYNFAPNGDSIPKVIVMSDGKHWVDGGDGDFMVMTGGLHSMRHRGAMYEGAKPGDTVRVKTIVSINGKETNVNEEEIIVGKENLHKQAKKMMIIHEDGDKKTKTRKIIINTDDANMKQDESGEDVFVFKSDSKEHNVTVNIDDVEKGDLKKLKVPKSAKELKVTGLFFMLSDKDMMSLSFHIDHKAKTTVRIYDLDGKKLFEDVKSNFSGKYYKEIPKMKGKMMLQVSQGKKYFHKKLEIEF